MWHEASLHPISSFITLTLSDEHLPSPPSLDPRHLELLWKRMRPGARFSYYACGEYGERSRRPHYHAILFGWWPDDAKRWKESAVGPLFKSSFLEARWGLGFVSLSAVSMATMVYVAKYVLKRDDDYSWVDPSTGEVVQLHPPFSRMSRRPAIGSGWVEKHAESDAWRHDDVILGGVKRRVPRYYDRKLQQRSEERYREMKRARAARRALSDPALLSTERIEAAAEIARVKRNLKKGEL